MTVTSSGHIRRLGRYGKETYEKNPFLRFLVAGVINTLFGYGIFCLMFWISRLAANITYPAAFQRLLWPSEAASRGCRSVASNNWGLAMTISLETDRLLLRDIKPSDLDDYVDHMTPEYYWRDIAIEPLTPVMVAQLLKLFITSQSQDPRKDYFFAVVRKQSEEFIGSCGLRIRSFATSQAEIAYGVAARHAGNGFATEIGRALLRFSFDDLKLHRVYAQCWPENTASRRIMIKIGMREEGVFRDYVRARGEWWSSAQYAILSTDQAVALT
jgi:ribosomal-protein-alanine N-acetyltransferase